MSGIKRETTEVRQFQITEAALQVIGKKGIRGATTAEIASIVGISEGNIYRHFRSKDEIVMSVIDRIGNDLAAILGDVERMDDPLQKLETIFKRHLKYIEEHVGVPRTIFSEEILVLNESLRLMVKDSLMNYFRGIQEIVAQGQNSGVFNREMDPDAVVVMFAGTINFTVIRWIMNDFSPKLADETEKLWKTFAKSIS